MKHSQRNALVQPSPQVQLLNRRRNMRAGWGWLGCLSARLANGLGLSILELEPRKGRALQGPSRGTHETRGCRPLPLPPAVNARASQSLHVTVSRAVAGSSTYWMRRNVVFSLVLLSLGLIPVRVLGCGDFYGAVGEPTRSDGLTAVVFGSSTDGPTEEVSTEGSDPVSPEQADDSKDDISGDPVGRDWFESKIRPMLIAHCLECHSAATQRSGELSLESREDWLAGGDSGPAIVPGDPDASLLWRAIGYEDTDLQMPPHQQLPDSVIADFRRWIQMGAPDPRVRDAQGTGPRVPLSVADAESHWAYRPVSNVDASEAIALGQHPIDYLLDQDRRDSLGVSQPIELNPKAVPAVLWRRLHQDLSGLPPEFDELESLPNEGSVSREHYEAKVDELLGRPAFGEQFARHWMDVVRYADSVTLRGFVFPNAWRYRDYLVHAFNEDRPFSQMILEQLAGDHLSRLPDASPLDDEGSSLPASDMWLKRRQQMIIATTFLTMGNTNLETQDKRLLELDHIDEQLDVIGQSFLGQTISCARCHDHKFDPIPTADYYAMAGILDGSIAMQHDNVSTWVEVDLPLSVEQETQLKTFNESLNAINQQLGELRRIANQQGDAAAVPLATVSGIVIDDEQAQAVGEWTLSNHTLPYVEMGYRHDGNQGQGLKSMTYQPDKLPPGRYELRLSYSAGGNRATNVTVDVFSAEGQATRVVNQRLKPSIDGLWHSLGEYRFEPDGQAYVMISNRGADGHVIVDCVQFLPLDREAIDPAPSQIAESSTASAAEKLQRVKTQIAQLEETRRDLQEKLKRPKAMSVLARANPTDLPIMIRGNHQRPGELVARGFLSAIPLSSTPAIPPDSDGRLQLARWIAADDHPLTARVYVNRLWLWLMGRGLVATPNQFGTTGAQPSHPKLLDWLAAEFVRSGWSTKHMVRLIVTSDAYQRASSIQFPAADQDPDNHWLWRSHRRRLTAESLRDYLLHCSGELDRTIGGSLIKPGTVADYNYRHDSVRRSLYQPVFRNALPALFREFDFADPSSSVGLRNRSTVVSQSLALWNSDWVKARVHATADRVWREWDEVSRSGDTSASIDRHELAPVTVGEQASTTSPSFESNEQSRNGLDEGLLANDADQNAWLINRAYQVCLQRRPTPSELKIGCDYLENKRADKSDTVEYLADLIQVLYSSPEFRYID